MKKHIIFSLGAGIAIPFVFFGTIVIASLFYPGYSQSRQFASELGAGFAPHPWIYNIGLTLRGAAEIIAAYGFLRVFQKLKLNPVLGVMAVAIVCISGFSALVSAHYNFPDPRHRAYGLQAAIVIGPVLFAATLRRITEARGLIIFLLVNNVLLFVTYLLSATPDNIGLMQRLRFLFSFPWVGICAYWLLWHIRKTPPNQSRGCVKSIGAKFGNDQISDMEDFDETSRWIGWSKNEFSHRLAPEPTAVGASVASHAASRRWLSFLR